MGLSFYERRKAAMVELGVPQRSRDVMGLARQKEHQHIYHSARWQQIRMLALRRHPVCPDPFGLHEGIAKPSEEVHHIVPLHDDMTKAYELQNLIALCHRCHGHADGLDITDPTKQRSVMRDSWACCI